MNLQKSVFYLFVLSSTLLCCSRRMTLTQMQVGYSLLSDEIKKEIRNIEKSIVGINAKINYEVQTYDYLTENGQLISDPASPVKYKLRAQNGSRGIIYEKDEKVLSGGGLVLSFSSPSSDYAILTSSHLVSPKDTTDIYYIDENGVETDVLFQKRIVKKVQLSVRGRSNWQVEAQLVASDPIDDLAVIHVNTDRFIAEEYQNRMGYDIDLTWGDWVFLFGYPREIKQMTGGWVSKSPYRGTFMVDAVVRFGFSGGPVFALSKDKSELVFVGIVKSVPSGSLDYIAHDGTLPVGYALSTEDLKKLIVSKEVMVNYGTVYCVDPQRIKEFIKLVRVPLENMKIQLDPKYFAR